MPIDNPYLPANHQDIDNIPPEESLRNEDGFIKPEFKKYRIRVWVDSDMREFVFIEKSFPLVMQKLQMLVGANPDVINYQEELIGYLD